jgi:hypothetical protein
MVRVGNELLCTAECYFLNGSTTYRVKERIDLPGIYGLPVPIILRLGVAAGEYHTADKCHPYQKPLITYPCACDALYWYFFGGTAAQDTIPKEHKCLKYQYFDTHLIIP